MQINYVPHFTWNNKDKGDSHVHKIGIRATNSLVNSSKKDTHKAVKTRKEILNEYGLNLDYDVSSSVPRLTLSINKGRWIGEDELADIYYLIYKQYVCIRNHRYRYNGAKTQDIPYNREAVKKLFMWVYFDNTTDINIGNHVANSMFSNENRKDIYEEIAILKQATMNVIGEFDYSEIFYHESNIYMSVLNDLFHKGYFVWQVYDSWYARKQGVSLLDYRKLVSELVEIEANKYIADLN